MITQLLEKYLHGVHAERILDVGPGYADFSRVSARLTGAREITFLDCDREVLEWQAAECAKAGLRAHALSVLLERDDLRTVGGTFDIIHCQEVLEHLPNARDVLLALVQHLSHGGRIIVTVPTGISERWLRLLNPSYMKNQAHGHVNLFTAPALTGLLREAGLAPVVFLPAQPHYFIAHTWLALTRMEVEGSTGRVLTAGFRGFVLGSLTSVSKRIFAATGGEWWGRVFPRNYFVIAERAT